MLLKRALLFIFMLSCFPAVSAERAMLSKDIASQSMPECRFGVSPWQKTRKFNQIRQDYMPLLSWLTEQTQCRFVLITAKTYADLEQKVMNGVVHVAEIGAIGYVTVEKVVPEIKPIVTALQWDKDKTTLSDSYRGHILTLKQYEDINSLADLKDRPFGFVRKESSSGYRYPNVLLQEAGIDYHHYFSQTFFLGSHPNVTDAIKAGSVIAGATWGYNFRKAKQKHGNIFKSIAITAPIPNILFIAHPSLPNNVYMKMQQILPKVDTALLKDIPADGFVIRPRAFYDPARKVEVLEN